MREGWYDKCKKNSLSAKGACQFKRVYTEDFIDDYISLTDIASIYDEPSDVIKNWMRRKDAIIDF